MTYKDKCGKSSFFIVTAGVIIIVCFLAVFIVLQKNGSPTEIINVSRAGDIPFYSGCGTTKLCYGYPSNCINRQDCSAVVSVLYEKNIFTFQLREVGEAAYVGLGLSFDTSMGGDSVVECQQEGETSLSAHTSWTYDKVSPFTTRDDVPQDIIKLSEISYADGVLECKYTRVSESTIKGVDFNLTTDEFYLQIVSGTNVRANSVAKHDIICETSSEKVSLTTIAHLNSSSKVLVKLHAIFMLIAWVGTTSIAIILARYYKTTWPGVKVYGNSSWIAFHKLLSVLTWVLTITAFILVLVDVGGWSRTGDNPHAILGMTTIAICFIQPFVAIFSPGPSSSYRKIFFGIHFLFGYSSHILGIVTIFFGFNLSKLKLPDWSAYSIMISCVAIYLLSHIILTLTKMRQLVLFVLSIAVTGCIIALIVLISLVD